MIQREILKYPSPPCLTPDLINLLTQLCFYDKKIESAQLLFVFGSNILHDEIGMKLTNLLRENKFDILLITGGIANYNDSLYENSAESELILKHIPLAEFPKIQLIMERKSKNTLENVRYANSLLNLSTIKKLPFFPTLMHPCALI
ncbi:ElyC/SanA/YdcF family protein [Elizabethkingia argenteiflava]|uniref:ElyC/SanA/YdcF family protein n=1 Tax=Elizabethkingia argenteiflava TaxID=2681556 RepID=UPI001FCEB9E4|nr:ElyC/SanA/YdcF family protein [Elizabethkingia argenteiflava]